MGVLEETVKHIFMVFILCIFLHSIY